MRSKLSDFAGLSGQYNGPSSRILGQFSCAGRRKPDKLPDIRRPSGRSSGPFWAYFLVGFTNIHGV